MTLVQLRHLMALADLASFSKAAAASFVTQPALSRSIRALEDELGFKLVDRMGRQVLLTSEGRATLTRARQIVGDADDLRQQGKRSRSANVLSLRIGLGAGPGALLMDALLLQAAQRHPTLTLEIQRGTEGLLPALRDRQLDALVADARAIRPAPDLKAEFVYEMRGAFLVRPGHPLTQTGRALRFEQLLDYPIASTPLSDEVARLLLERYGPQALPEACVSLRCSELSHLVTLAERSDTVLLAVRAAAPQLVELVLSPVMNIGARFGLVTLARRSEPPGLDLVRELMVRCMQD